MKCAWKTVVLAACGAGVPLLALGWHGDGTGRYPDAEPPLTWNRDSQVAWKVEIPQWSNASPAVQGDRVLVCAEPATVQCHSLVDGALLWQATQDYADVAPTSSAAQEARDARQALERLEPRLQEAERTVRKAKDEIKKNPESPTEAQQALATAEAARDALRKELSPYGKYRFPERHETTGLTSPTPACDGTRFFVLMGSGTLAAYTLDGQRAWGRDAGRPKHGWGHSASPVLAGDVLIVHLGDHLLALDPATGQERWQAASPSGWGTPAVAKAGDGWIVITPSGDWFDVRDGRKTASGVQSFPWNGPMVVDGVVYQIDERGASAVAVNPDGTPRPLWKADVPKGRYYATAVLHGGLLYNVHQGGRLTVLDAADGSPAYQQDLPFGGRKTVYPSPFVAADRLYFSADNGVTVVVQPGREYRELARNETQAFRSTPVPVGKRLLVRTLSGLSCFE